MNQKHASPARHEGDQDVPNRPDDDELRETATDEDDEDFEDVDDEGDEESDEDSEEDV